MLERQMERVAVAHPSVSSGVSVMAGARAMDGEQEIGKLRAAVVEGTGGVDSMEVVLPTDSGVELRLRVVAQPEKVPKNSPKKL